MRYYIDSFGCAKNQVDSENMMAYLNQTQEESAITFDCACEPEDADIIIVNSCGFIESAKSESINAVLSWRKLYPQKKILLAGCLAERYGKELKDILPEADGFFGVSAINKISASVSALFGITEKNEKPAKEPASGKRPLLSSAGSAYVKISEGCNNRCSFCAIPLIRGNLKSRNPDDILDECKTLLDRGIKELCIIGQDISSYGNDFSDAQNGLQKLLEKLSFVSGNFWARLLYIHPDNFPLPILDVMKSDRRILPYFDLPFQHGSEKILSLMNRRGNTKKYLDLLNKIRTVLPDSVIRTTFLTGFPGEDENDFKQLLEFQKEASFDWMGCFSFSCEEGTKAFSLKNKVPKKKAAERKNILEENQIPITEKNMERFIGREAEILVEEKFEGEDSLWLGRLACHAPEVDGAAVVFPGEKQTEAVPGQMAACRIFGRAGFDFKAELF